MDDYLIGSATSVFSVSRLRVRFWPILATLGLAFLLLLPGGLMNAWVRERLGMERSMAMPWLGHYVDHAVMLVIALVLVAWLSKGRVSEYGLQWPKSKSYALAAAGWGALFGVLMTVVDYLPQILTHTPPPDQLSSRLQASRGGSPSRESLLASPKKFRSADCCKLFSCNGPRAASAF
jgi:hypothetical protein